MSRTRSSAATFLGLSLAASILLSSCTTAPASPSQSSSQQSATPTSGHPSSGSQAPASGMGTPATISTGLGAPWSVAFLNDTPLVSERDSSRILEVASDGSTRAIGTVAGVEGAGEGGLLGIAVDGQGRLYAYSTAAGGNRIQRFAISGKPGALALGQAETILEDIPSASNHNGGRLAFGPDGMLYATTGDAGQRTLAQDLGSLGGKILRMTPDGDVPQDNPFSGSLVYSYGHRNPQGLAWAADGTMFATEFGQNTWDELNIITAGANYGWPTVEGVATTDGFTDPVQQWKPDVASPSGMAQRDGMLYIANLRGEVLRAVPVADPTTSTDYFVGEFGRLRDVTVAPNGPLWVLTNNTDGRGTPGAEDDRILAFIPE
ncbi:sorbosone dehydrogenase family protein [Arthrobacter sp. N199823]|uniref:PQQ-dependent sugar dehydrogenase n=1 Tax=Arthrobacter sp. N199823 TaxID=2058895 RepID=UPI001C66E2D0|nr:PQQ-dependent sugar dehydrogenase [Arthrobacter sp. N199823]